MSLELDFDLQGALEAGHTPEQIAPFVAQQVGFDYEAAKQAGHTDNQIISYIVGSPSKAFAAQAEYSGASSILGLGQLAAKTGLVSFDEKRAKSFRDAADILSTNYGISGGTGTLAGAILDPVAFPTGLIGKASMTAQGAIQGLTGGILEPILSEEDSRIRNTAVGTVFGGGLGAGLGYVARKLGGEQAAKAADVVSPEAAAKESGDLAQASEAAIARVAETPSAVDYNIPAWQRAGYNVDEAVAKEQAAAAEAKRAEEIKLVDAKIEELSVRAQQIEQEKAALPAQTKQEYYVNPEAGVDQRAVHDYMVGQRSRALDIEKQKIEEQIAQLQIAKGEQPTRAPSVAEQVAARDQRVAAVEQRIAQRDPAQSAPVPEAPARIAPAGQPPRSALNLGFGADSISAAKTPPEMMYAHDMPFNTNVEKVFNDKYKGRAQVAAVSDNEYENEIMSKVVAAAGYESKKMRGKASMGGSLEATTTLGEKAAEKMTAEENSVAEWMFKNRHESWNREQIAAGVKEFIKSREFVMNTIDEYNALRAAGKLTPELEQRIMLNTQFHLGVMSVFQGQRTKASMALNAFKLAKNTGLRGEKMTGYANPKIPC